MRRPLIPVLVLMIVAAGCGGGDDADSATPVPAHACSLEAPDGYCDPDTNMRGQTLACDRGECVATWAGKCSPGLRSGTCYDPALPSSPVPAQLAPTCCAGECIAARATIGRDCR